MVDINSRVLDVLERIERNTEYTTRAHYDGKTPQRGSKAQPFGSLPRQVGMFAESARRLTSTFKDMHSSADNFLSSLGRLSRNFLALDLVVEAVKGGVELGKQFSKLTDIGQFFGGSMIEMGRQAGESGLSLKEFSDMLQKNSVATAVMNQGHLDTTSAMGSLQKGVRDTLKEVGFYGMSLVQLTSDTSDYMETMRQTGQLSRMNSEQQRRAVVSLMGDVTAFSQATGKSREEILKGVNAALREPTAAMRMAAEGITETQRLAFTKIAAMFSSLPGQAGEMMPKFFSQMFGAGGNAFFTQMGQTFISSGMPQLNSMMESIVQGVNIGEPIEESAHKMFAMGKEILANQGSLRNLQFAGVQQAGETLAIGQSMLGLDEKEFIMKTKRLDIDNKAAIQMNKLTQATLLFESQFQTVTSGLREGFYESFGKAMEKFDPGAGFVTDLRDSLKALGEVLGTLLAQVFSKENIDFLTKQITAFTSWLSKIAKDPKFTENLMKIEGDIIFAVKAIAVGLGYLASFVEKVAKVYHWIASLVLPQGESWVVAIIGTWLTVKFLPTILKLMAGGFMSFFKTGSFFSPVTNVRGGVVNVIGAGGIGGGGGGLGGGPGPFEYPPGAGTPPGGAQGWRARTGQFARKYGPAAASVTAAVVGAGNEALGGPSWLTGAATGASFGSWLGFRGALVGAVVGGISSALWNLAAGKKEEAKKTEEPAKKQQVTWMDEQTGEIITDPARIARLEKKSPTVIPELAGVRAVKSPSEVASTEEPTPPKTPETPGFMESLMGFVPEIAGGLGISWLMNKFRGAPTPAVGGGAGAGAAGAAAETGLGWGTGLRLLGRGAGYGMLAYYAVQEMLDQEKKGTLLKGFEENQANKRSWLWDKLTGATPEPTPATPTTTAAPGPTSPQATAPTATSPQDEANKYYQAQYDQLMQRGIGDARSRMNAKTIAQEKTLQKFGMYPSWDTQQDGRTITRSEPPTETIPTSPTSPSIVPGSLFKDMFSQPGALPTPPAPQPTQMIPDVTTLGDTLKSTMPGDTLKPDLAALRGAIDRQTDTLALLLDRNNRLTEDTTKRTPMDYLLQAA